MLFDSLTDKFRKMIQDGSKNNDRLTISQLESAADRPRNLSSDGLLRRDYYLGHHLGHFSLFLAGLYEQAQAVTEGHKKEINEIDINYIATWADTAADIYRAGAPTRRGATDAETARLDALCDAANCDVFLPEMEKKMHTSRGQFGRVLRNPATDKLEITEFWPCDVYPIVDPRAPNSLESCLAVGLRVSEAVFEVWLRNPDNTWDAWQIYTDDRTPVRLLRDPYTGRLPIVAMYPKRPSGSVFLDDDGNLIRLANNAMLQWTELGHLIRMQAHNTLWIASSKQNIQINGGPGGFTLLEHDDTMGYLDTKPMIEDTRQVLSTYVSAAARSHGQSPRSYQADPVPLNSSIALRADDKQNEEGRPLRVANMSHFEIKDLLPVLDEVDRLLPAKNKANVLVKATIDFSKISLEFPRSPNIEDTAQKQLRLEHAVDASFISRARAAVEAGYYSTIKQAEEAMKDLPPPVVSTAGASLDTYQSATQRQGPQPTENA